jgi:hypothetical protein
MTQTIQKFLLCIPFLALPACVDNDRFGRPAKLCADAVRIYRGLPNPVEITDELQQTTDGVVEIRFQSMSAENTPVTGVATCEFSVGPDGSLALVAASLDQSRVPEPDLAAINRKLGEG